MKRGIFLVLLLLVFTLLAACGTGYDTKSESSLLTEASSAEAEQSEPKVDPSQPESTTQEPESESPSKEDASVKIQITVGDTTLTAIPENNSSAKAFLALLQEGPVTVEMSDYAGMEKVGPLGTTLPRNDTQISVDAGDVILYQGNQITIYYGTNSWNFTKLAVIEGATKESLLKVLGVGNVDVTFSLAE